MARPLILHHHIFKNAGSTLDYALERQFGSAFAMLDDPEDEPLHDRDLLMFLAARPDVRAISSHHFHGRAFAPDPSGETRYLDLALVRRPLPRLISAYKFYRRAGSLDGVGELAPGMTARAFIATLLEQEPHQVNSAQVSILGNRGWYLGPIREDDFQRAVGRYRDFALCGPVERYDEAMVVFEHLWESVGQGEALDLAYVRQNVSDGLEGEDDLSALLGDDVVDRLIADNDYDERLWAFAGAELDRRIQQVPKFERRLDDFRTRCVDLERANEAYLRQ